MIPTNNESHQIEVFKRLKNSPYEYEQVPTIFFSARLANQIEKKNYRIQKGVNGNTDSSFLFVSNLPEEVEVGDKIKFLGKIWSVMSVGYYFDASRIANARIFSEKQIVERCPKGINIQ